MTWEMASDIVWTLSAILNAVCGYRYRHPELIVFALSNAFCVGWHVARDGVVG